MKSLTLTLLNLSIVTAAPISVTSQNLKHDNSNHSEQEIKTLKESLINIFENTFKNDSISIQNEIKNINEQQPKNQINNQINKYVNDFLKTIVGNLIFEQNNNTFNNNQIQQELNNQIDLVKLTDADIVNKTIQNIFKYLGQRWIDENKNSFSYEELNKDLSKSPWTIKQENKKKYEYWANQARQIFSGFYFSELDNNNSWFVNDKTERTDDESQNIYFEHVIKPKLYLLNYDPKLKHNQKSKKMKTNAELKKLINSLNLNNLQTYRNLLSYYAKYFKDEFYRFHKNINYTFFEIWRINPAIIFSNEEILDSKYIPKENVKDMIKNFYLEDIKDLFNLNLNINDINWNNNINFTNKLNENASLIYKYIATPLIDYIKSNVLENLFTKHKITQQDKTRILNLLNEPRQELRLLIDTIGIYSTNSTTPISVALPQIAFFNIKIKLQQVINEIGKIVKPNLNSNPDLNFYNYKVTDLDTETEKENEDIEPSKVENKNENIEKDNKENTFTSDDTKTHKDVENDNNPAEKIDNSKTESVQNDNKILNDNNQNSSTDNVKNEDNIANSNNQKENVAETKAPESDNKKSNTNTGTETNKTKENTEKNTQKSPENDKKETKEKIKNSSSKNNTNNKLVIFISVFSSLSFGLVLLAYFLKRKQHKRNKKTR
ncbi:hypothetical protein [Mycoplasma zalophi]|uniref:hypothetical protein n=1 Tax=Mycoplasma zalophi TaxID=191287 RepID=UPI001C10B526|nr:hypothetical protein [Mycoplasma zalophi]MBU4691059.1 hypothetical protein [Mycoplasma zalophi]